MTSGATCDTTCHQFALTSAVPAHIASRALAHASVRQAEVLTASDLEALRQEMFAELASRKTAAGIPMTASAPLVLAEKRAP